MQQFPLDNDDVDIAACAASVVDVGLAVTRLVRAQLRRHGRGRLTLPQIRALAFVNADPDSAPSQLAEHLMLTRPAVTRLIDALGKQRLITRRAHPDDRRRLQLAATAAGREKLDTDFGESRAIIAGRLAELPVSDRTAVRRAMRMVGPVVASQPPESSHEAG